MKRSALLLRRSILLGVPLTLAILMLFHPWPYDNYLGKLVPIAAWWTTLHTIQFVLFPFVGLAIWFLISGLGGLDVMISRSGAVVFGLFYTLADDRRD